MENKFGYCMKCKQKREISNPKEIIMKNKRKAIQGTCLICGSKIFRILGKKDEIHQEETTEEISNI